MKKVLFTFVGNQDPVSNSTDEEGPIVTLIRDIKPDLVYAFPSAEGVEIKSSTQKKAGETKFWIEDSINKNIQFFIRTLELKDPTDYVELINNVKYKIGKILDNELKGNFDEYELHANCSSGTPTMKSLWIVFSSIGYIPNLHLWQVANPKYSDKRIKEINDAFLREENIIARIKEYAYNSQFQLVANQLNEISKITIYSSRKNKASILKKIFEGYAKWDLIKYKEALDILVSAMSLIQKQIDMKDVESILSSQITILKSLCIDTEKENDYNLVDLYYNTLRKYANDDYTDVIARFWRMYEGILFKILSSKGINARNLKDNNKESIKDILNSTKNYLSLNESDELLTKYKKDEKFIEFKKNKLDNFYIGKTMDYLRKKRNNSIVAHGMKPIEKDDASEAVKILSEMIKRFIKNDENLDLIDSYPLNINNSLKLIKILDTN